MNRLFPGDSSGESSGKIAFFVFEQANKIADIIVDLHSGGERWVVPFYVLVPRGNTVTHINSLELAKFIDCPIIWLLSDSWLQGSMVFQSNGCGIISILVESGGAIVTEADIDDYHKVLIKTLKWAEMFEESFEITEVYHERNKVPIIVDECSFLYSKCGEIFFPKLSPGEILNKGQRIGHLLDSYGIL